MPVSNSALNFSSIKAATVLTWSVDDGSFIAACRR
jgi:hypothetical protein